MFAYKKLSDMTSEEKIRACYQHSVLKLIEGKRMTNESLRKRFGIEKQNYSTASRIISETIKAEKIKKFEKLKEYIPFWA